ncbi:MAG: lipid A export permease/ATP-binding protein MsbA [Methylotenera sp.]
MSKPTIKKVSEKLSAANAPTSKIMLMRLFKYAWKYKLVFLCSLLALVVLSATNTAFLATIKQVTDEGFVKQSANQVAYLPFLLFGLMAVRSISGFASVFSMRWVSRRVVENLRLDTFAQLMRLPISYFDDQSVGTVVTKLTYDVEQMANAATKAALTLVRDTLTVLGILGYMLYLDWRLTMIFVVVVPLMGVYLKNMRPRLKFAAHQAQESVGEMTKVAEESMSGQRIVKIFGAQAYENERFAFVAAKNRRMQIRLARFSGLNSMVIELIAAVSLGFVVYYAVGRFTAGEFSAFVGALFMIIAPIKNLTAMNEDIQVALVASQSVFGVIDITPELDEGEKISPRSQGAIEFKHVSLTYSNAKRPALNDISFSIKSGEKLALVGRSGGGKTTLVNLLPRFYELQQGQVLLDGVDMRALPLANLREQFSLVSQDVLLFNDTIFNNIAYGVLRNASEEEVINAAKAAHAWEFIQQQPNGLYSEIGDRGVRLSGGQRQRIAIARAILKNAPILLLDEATSALDTESEQHVQAALDALMQNRTSIVIAHRLSTVENADRIMVMEQGEIVESGTHEALIQQNGHYAKLYQKQFTG